MIKLYSTKESAINAMKQYNKSLSSKCFNKYFRVVIEGYDNNYAVVDFKTAYDMQVSYTF